MLARVSTVTLMGLATHPVEVEADIGLGLPSFTIVGLPDPSIQEARERVRSAIRNSNLPFPVHRLTVNLAPADLRKDGSQFDLAIAIGILVANGYLPPQPTGRLFYAELALDGRLRKTRGVLPVILDAALHDYQELFIATANATEAQLAADRGVFVYPVDSLSDLIEHLTHKKSLVPLEARSIELMTESPTGLPDLQDIKGQLQAKRCLEIAAAGGHNLLFKGPPGTGKTLLARAIIGILPRLTFEEALAVTRIYSVANLLQDQSLFLTGQRPFRAPHHTASSASIVGGGSVPRPGEVSLAHHGVLFLDELPEFARPVLEALRQPLEDRLVTVVRAAGSYQYPANFMLVAACNPCPCGYFGSPDKACQCTAHQVRSYEKRLSGPFLDRIDLHLLVPKVPVQDLMTVQRGESSQVVQERVEKARQCQLNRFRGTVIGSNAMMRPDEIARHCQTDRPGKQLLRSIIDSYALSARGYYRLLRVARTIADLDEHDTITVTHISEATLYRHQASN